jgi:hypothetical protein
MVLVRPDKILLATHFTGMRTFYPHTQLTSSSSFFTLLITMLLTECTRSLPSHEWYEAVNATLHYNIIHQHATRGWAWGSWITALVHLAAGLDEHRQWAFRNKGFPYCAPLAIHQSLSIAPLIDRNSHMTIWGRVFRWVDCDLQHAGGIRYLVFIHLSLFTWIFLKTKLTSVSCDRRGR